MSPSTVFHHSSFSMTLVNPNVVHIRCRVLSSCDWRTSIDRVEQMRDDENRKQKGKSLKYKLILLFTVRCHYWPCFPRANRVGRRRSRIKERTKLHWSTSSTTKGTTETRLCLWSTAVFHILVPLTSWLLKLGFLLWPDILDETLNPYWNLAKKSFNSPLLLSNVAWKTIIESSNFRAIHLNGWASYVGFLKLSKSLLSSLRTFFSSLHQKSQQSMKLKNVVSCSGSF